MLRIRTAITLFICSALLPWSTAGAADVHFDLGDIIVGGDGCGAIPIGGGVNPRNGKPAQPGTFGGAATVPPKYYTTDGSGGTVNLPYVDGVFVADGTGRITSTSMTFAFPDTEGSHWDAIRNGLALVEGTGIDIPIELSDQPTVLRRGLGVHSNCGITFDLAAIRAAYPGASTARVEGVAGMNSDVAWNGDVDIWVIVDGVQKAKLPVAVAQTAAFSVPLSGTDTFLTLACTDFDLSNGSDHGVIADAVLVMSGLPDCNGNLVLDSCDIQQGTSLDCNLNGIPDECEGGFTVYGAGCPGSGTFVPKLSMWGCPTPGGVINVEVTEGLGGASAFFFYGAVEAALPMGGGCTLNIQPILPLMFSIPLGGFSSGQGSTFLAGSLPAVLPQPLQLTSQVFVVDTGGANGYSNTNGVKVVFVF